MTNAIDTARAVTAARRRDPLFPVGIAAAVLGAVHLVAPHLVTPHLVTPFV